VSKFYHENTKAPACHENFHGRPRKLFEPAGLRAVGMQADKNKKI
jgi:hypothetical protein